MAGPAELDNITIPHNIYIGVGLNKSTSPWSLVKQTKTIDLADYPLGTECFYALINFGRLENTEPIHVVFTFRKNWSGEQLFRFDCDIPTPKSQGWDWWNWYSVCAWIGHFYHEIDVPGTYAVEIIVDSGTGLGCVSVKCAFIERRCAFVAIIESAAVASCGVITELTVGEFRRAAGSAVNRTT